MLEVEGLNWSSNIVITSNSFLHVLSVVFVGNSLLVQFFVEAAGREMECENSFRLFKKNGHI